jgi:hypothetical protein
MQVIKLNKRLLIQANNERQSRSEEEIVVGVDVVEESVGVAVFGVVHAVVLTGSHHSIARHSPHRSRRRSTIHSIRQQLVCVCWSIINKMWYTHTHTMLTCSAFITTLCGNTILFSPTSAPYNTIALNPIVAFFRTTILSNFKTRSSNV